MEKSIEKLIGASDSILIIGFVIVAFVTTWVLKQALPLMTLQKELHSEQQKLLASVLEKALDGVSEKAQTATESVTRMEKEIENLKEFIKNNNKRGS